MGETKWSSGGRCGGGGVGRQVVALTRSSSQAGESRGLGVVETTLFMQPLPATWGFNIARGRAVARQEWGGRVGEAAQQSRR